MKEILYIVKNISGDYAILIDEQGNENPTAIFLLPDNINVGTKILFRNFEYEIIS
ncbi:MAG: hypothetical protein R3Y12_08940 [Clostridia bacterium]